MAVDSHPSRRPSEPRKPPATSTTAGTINKMPASASGQAGVEYGARHEISVKPAHKSEMAHHFAPHAGHEASNEPSSHKVGHAGHPGDENAQDEPD